MVWAAGECESFRPELVMRAVVGGGTGFVGGVRGDGVLLAGQWRRCRAGAGVEG